MSLSVEGSIDEPPISDWKTHEEIEPRRRDQRVDLFRGIALLFIFVDHVEFLNSMRLASDFTLRSIGLCDATEVFVFTSGFVCGIRYWPVITKSGFTTCFVKAIRRAGKIWLANIASLWIVINLVYACYGENGANFARYRLGGLGAPLTVQVPRVLLQLYQPAVFDVLTLYVHLVLVFPLFLLGLLYVPRLAWLIVASVYIIAFRNPWLNYPMYDPYSGLLTGTVRTFNHFS